MREKATMDNYLDYEAELGNFVHHFARFEQQMNSNIDNLNKTVPEHRRVNILCRSGDVKPFTKRISLLKSLIQGKNNNKYYSDCRNALSDLEVINKFRNDVIHGFLSYDTFNRKFVVTPIAIFFKYSIENDHVDISTKGFEEWIRELNVIKEVLQNFTEEDLPQPIFGGWSEETLKRKS